MRSRPILYLLLILFIFAAPARAQNRLELIPFGGSYVPLTAFGSTQTIAQAPQGGPLRNSTFKESIGVLLGARLRLSLSDLVMLQGSGAYVWSGWRETQKANVAGAQEVGFSLAGNVFQGSGQLLYKPRRTNAYGSIGVIYMARGGDAWDEEKWVDGTEYNKTNVGLTVGLGVDAAAAGWLRFDIAVESRIYSVHKVNAGFVLSNSEPLESNSFQSDFVVTVGIPISLIAR